MGEAGAPVRDWTLDRSGGPFCNDPTRIVINVRGAGRTGHAIERLLRRGHGLQIELSDAANIVLLLSLGDTVETADHFLRAFEDVIRGADVIAGDDAREAAGIDPGTAGLIDGLLPPTPPMILRPADAFDRRLRRIRLEEATDLVSGDMIAAYPPGVPVIYPGERLTRAVTDYLVRARESGVHLSGGEDSDMRWINVIDGKTPQP